ncbi:TipAS antibiotic-recognition domain-containing protein, partial [Turicibacter sanguinis]
IKMTDKQKFEGLKKQLIEENEQRYGQELREKYGEDVINHSNKQFKNLSKEQYEAMNQLSYEILALLEEAMETNNPESELAQVLAKKHHEWLGYTWPSYSKEAHAGLAQMYVADPRFTAYYDEKIKPGAAQFLCDAILVYTK